MQNLLTLNKKYRFVLLLLLASTAALSQPGNTINDLMLCNEVQHRKHHVKNRQPYIFKGEPASFRTLNPLSLAYGGSLFLYQNHLTRHFSASCLYSPSCSHFSKEAVAHFGLIKGGLLTFDRLSRCNRIAATDLDPSRLHPASHTFHDPVERYP